jgi:hypothetical protein
MSLPTPELKLGYDLFSKLLNWAAGKRQSKRLEALKSAAFQELLKGDAANLDLVASALKEIHKAESSKQNPTTPREGCRASEARNAS